MSIGGYGPFEPPESSELGRQRGRPLRWWQLALILQPLAALLGAMMVWGRW
jgi:hypothetical protein